jgi:hypothetical protein
LRAGLLSEEQVIELVNRKFVATWIIVDDAEKLAQKGDAFAQTLFENWEFPLDIMFLAPDGVLLDKLNSFKDLRDAHSDVGHPPEGRGLSAPHLVTFLRFVQSRFGGE